MNIQICGRHFEVTDELKSLALEKFGRIEKYFHGIQKIEVILKDEDRKRHCEAILHVKNRASIIVDVARDTIQEAIDVAVDKCEQQSRRLKEKLSDRRRKGSERFRPSAPPPAEPESDPTEE